MTFLLVNRTNKSKNYSWLFKQMRMLRHLSWHEGRKKECMETEILTPDVIHQERT
uniref:Uncharacterized protein n=1 Tax=Rhizophora mucronata TaxID=61149 RepID=A0A2P2P2B7_RHIMU